MKKAYSKPNVTVYVPGTDFDAADILTASVGIGDQNDYLIGYGEAFR